MSAVREPREWMTPKELAAYEMGRRDEREACAKVCDGVALSRAAPDNIRSANPRATAQSAACKCAWEIRQRGRP